MQLYLKVTEKSKRKSKVEMFKINCRWLLEASWIKSLTNMSSMWRNVAFSFAPALVRSGIPSASGIVFSSSGCSGSDPTGFPAYVAATSLAVSDAAQKNVRNSAQPIYRAEGTTILTGSPR